MSGVYFDVYTICHLYRSGEASLTPTGFPAADANTNLWGWVHTCQPRRMQTGEESLRAGAECLRHLGQAFASVA